MCGCFALLLGAFFPRVTLVLLWIFSDLIGRAFDNQWLLPLAGVLLLPYTTLAYVLVFWYTGAVTGFGWAFVILGLVLDLGSYTSAGRSRRQMA